MKTQLLLIAYLPLISCGQLFNNEAIHSMATYSLEKKISTAGDIPLPEGYKRVDADENSFTHFLRAIKLKKDNRVYLYNGDLKTNQAAQYAVLDIPVGKENLQQCADAVMRLRAEYLFTKNRFKEIVFKDNNGKAYRFNQPYTKTHFHQYLKTVFSFCGTASLSRQLTAVSFDAIEPGDVLLKGGSPGHAVIVMEVAVNNQGKKIYMLAQSYMPAQDIHILNNQKFKKKTPWYFIDNEKIIETTKWIFYNYQLMKWLVQ